MNQGEHVQLHKRLNNPRQGQAAQHLWACAFQAAMSFMGGGEDGLGDGHGLYGRKDAIIYEYSDTRLPDAINWRLAVWRNSEGVVVAPADEIEQ